MTEDSKPSAGSSGREKPLAQDARFPWYLRHRVQAILLWPSSAFWVLAMVGLAAMRLFPFECCKPPPRSLQRGLAN